MDKKKVVVIGAGPAGLTAAYELLKENKAAYDIVVLEKTNAIGGISRTVKFKGNRMDIGGHRFFSKDQRVVKWWEDMMPLQGSDALDDKMLGRIKPLKKGGPDPELTDNVMLIRQRISRIYYMKKFFDYPVSAKWQTFKNMGLLKTILAGFSYMKSVIIKKEESSLENFYINRFGKVLYEMFFEGYTEKLWGVHPRDISADWGAQRVKGLSILAVIKDMFSKILPGNKNRKVETSLIEEFCYPKLGPGQLWETVTDEIKTLGGSVEMNSEVKNIEITDNKISKVKYLNNGELKEIGGDIFISSMPVKDLINAMGETPNENVQKIAEGLPYRDFITVGMLVDKLNLKNETNLKTLSNIIPDCWIYVQDVNVKLGRIQIFNNWSPYMMEDPINTVWIGLEYFCTEGDEFWNLNNEELIEYATKELVKMGIINSKEDVKDAHSEKVEKAYPAYFGTYNQMDEVISYLDTIDNIYCVGRNGQHRYNNMDHSMATSFETVKNIVNDVKSNENIWSVNTDKEYHEEKKDEK